MERHHRMPSLRLPETPHRNQHHSDDQRCDDVRSAPVLSHLLSGDGASSDRQRNEDKRQYSDEQNHSDNVQLPEQTHGQLAGAHHSVGCRILLKIGCT